MNLLIFGASGKTGHHLVQQSLNNGHRVTAFVRNPLKLNISHANLNILKGDVSDYPAVEAAISGHDAVFSTLGAASPFRFDQSIVDGMIHIVRAMEEKKVSRLIYMSAINVSESRKHGGPLIRILGTTLLRTETAGHETREQIIRQSRLLWTLVRPAGLTNGEKKEQYRIGEHIRANGFAASISRADVAHFMVQQLTDQTYLQRAPMVMY